MDSKRECVMRFKKILKEVREDEEKIKHAQNLSEVLRSDYQYNNKNLLYRGANTRIDENGGYWTIRPIRKNRKPRDTPKIVHFLILGVEDALYPNVPSRSESKFAIEGYDSSELNRYGNYTFVCFPEKTASVYSLSRDATAAYFGKIKGSIENLTGDWHNYQPFDLSDYKVTKRFVKYLRKYSDTGKVHFYEYQEFVENNFQRMKMELKKMKRNDEDIDNDFVENYEEFFENVSEYFEEMEVGVQDDSKEVLFDGDTYLKIEAVFFKNFFEWRRNSWKLKPEFMS